MAEKPGIAIIEDHPIMREGLAAWFAGSGRWLVTGTASSLAGAKELLTQAGAQTDIVLLDIQLEDGWGLDIIPWYTKLAGLSKRPIMAVYSTFDDYGHVNIALGLGVKAYICKRRGEQELEKALLKALAGGSYIDEAAQTNLQTVTDIFNLLTRREAEILKLVKKGLSNKQIAASFGISHRTVENILSCVYDKTGIHSRVELQKL